MRKNYEPNSADYNAAAWQAARFPSTTPRGDSGAAGASVRVSTSGCQQIRLSTPSSLPSSPSTAEVGPQAAGPTLQPPCFPSSAISRGIIKFDSATQWACTLDTPWPCAGCSGCHSQQEQKHSPPPPSSAPSAPGATSKSPTTAIFGGLRS